MTQKIAFPYRQFSPDSFSFSDWFKVDPSGEIETIGDGLGHWDYNDEVRLKRAISIDMVTALESAGLNTSADIKLVVRAVTGPTSIRKTVAEIEVPHEQAFEIDLEIELPSDEMCGQVTLFTDFVLGTQYETEDELTARRCGSKMAGDERKIILEGSLGRFPTQMVDFHSALTRLDAPHALWHLEWDPARPGASFLGSVQLYLNKSRDDLVSAIENNDPLLLTTIRCDVIIQLVRGLLENEEFLNEETEFHEESVGEYAKNWIEDIFGNISLTAVRTMIGADPAEFQTRVQSRFG